MIYYAPGLPNLETLKHIAEQIVLISNDKRDPRSHTPRRNLVSVFSCDFVVSCRLLNFGRRLFDLKTAVDLLQLPNR